MNEASSKTVLIVDDAKFVRAKLRGILEQGGFTVVGEAEDGEQAVEVFKQTKPTITTLDITMPKMDGLSALKEIRSIEPTAKVVMISALGQKEKVKDCIQAGALDFVLKPFVAEKVVSVLNRIAES